MLHYLFLVNNLIVWQWSLKTFNTCTRHRSHFISGLFSCLSFISLHCILRGQMHRCIRINYFNLMVHRLGFFHISLLDFPYLIREDWCFQITCYSRALLKSQFLIERVRLEVYRVTANLTIASNKHIICGLLLPLIEFFWAMDRKSFLFPLVGTLLYIGLHC